MSKAVSSVSSITELTLTSNPDLSSISIAPMMGCTDRHFRYLARLIAPGITLYTEMITTKALLHGHPERLLAYDAAEQPLVLQLGGHEPDELASCATIAANAGFAAVNLNLGCPSTRVQSGKIGVILLREPQLVAAGIAAMHARVSIPVTAKIRIGVDELDSYAYLADFVDTLVCAGCTEVIVHARKAWLTGLNPKQNRNVPPLDYARVYQLKRDFPDLTITINGGITSVDAVHRHLQQVDGIMIGRKAYADPWFLHELVASIQGNNRMLNQLPTPTQVVEQALDYMRAELKRGTPLWAMTRHLLNLFKGKPGAKSWRRMLSEQTRGGRGSLADVEAALKCMQ